MERTLIATAAFGLEAVVRREIEKLGYPVVRTENGKITFTGHEDAIAKANLWLRAADRVLVRMAEFKAADFEELYQNIAGIPWEEWIPVDGRIVVDAGSVKSTLTSVPAVQSVSAKAGSVTSLMSRPGCSRRRKASCTTSSASPVECRRVLTKASKSPL